MYVHKTTKQLSSKQQERHKGLYDQRCRGAELEIGAIVSVRQTVWKGRLNIQDRGK